MDREEIGIEIENLEWKKEMVDKMYTHAKALVDLEDEIKRCNEEIDLDFDLVQLRNTIDRLSVDLDNEIENLNGQLENIDDNTNEYLNHEYWQSQF